MLEEMAAESGMTAWAIVSLLFFVAVYVIVAVRVLRARREDLRTWASLPLDGDGTRGDDG
jgi:hypothetical protein